MFGDISFGFEPALRPTSPILASRGLQKSPNFTQISGRRGPDLWPGGPGLWPGGPSARTVKFRKSGLSHSEDTFDRISGFILEKHYHWHLHPVDLSLILIVARVMPPKQGSPAKKHRI